MLRADNVIRVLRPAKDACLIDVAEYAVAASLNLITNGSELILCSEIPEGWKKFGVKFKPAETSQTSFPNRAFV